MALLFSRALGRSLGKNLALKRTAFCLQQQRCLYLHEFQSMALMRDYGVKTPKFAPASSPKEAEDAAKEVMGSAAAAPPVTPTDVVVKAQVLSGGRGLGYFKENAFQGGVHVCTSPAEVKDVAGKMLGKTLVTKQTGKEGKPCRQVLVAERFYIRREKYFAILMDRGTGGPMLLGSSVGGTSIEDIVEKHPDAIVKMPIDIRTGPTADQIQQFVAALGFAGKQAEEARACVQGLYRLFVDKDCLLVEVNPFAETHDGRVLVCDAKVSFDDNAEFRQSAVFRQKDDSQVDPREVAAARSNLNYVGLDGNIGCMVNGAGLAMATMDIIQLHGGTPANFLDVGGGADNDQVMEALRILEQDERVRSIFINIFGGIMRCDIIARGLIAASQKLGLSKPVVLRLEGTNKKEAQDLLDASGMKIAFESDFSAAARKAVKMAAILDAAKQASLRVSFDL